MRNLGKWKNKFYEWAGQDGLVSAHFILLSSWLQWALFNKGFGNHHAGPIPSSQTVPWGELFVAPGVVTELPQGCVKIESIHVLFVYWFF